MFLELKGFLPTVVDIMFLELCKMHAIIVVIKLNFYQK